MVTDTNFEENENPNFVDGCNIEGKQGVYVKGKDVIFLDAPAINFPENAPLDTDKRELYDILNELFQSGSGGGDVFHVSGSGSGITVTMVKNRGETQELTAEFFTFETKTYKTITTLRSGNTSIEKTWSKTVISAVLKYGVTVWKFTLDAVGTVTAVLDSAGNDVLNGVTGADGLSVITSTPEGIALGWALAYNNEQTNALQKALDAYQDGVDDCDKINEAEGVGGETDGDDTGDGTGGDGTGDGTGSGGIKLPDKNYSSLPIPYGVEVPEGMAAYSVRYNYNGGTYYWFASSINVTQYSSTGRLAVYMAPSVSFTIYDDGTIRDRRYYTINTATSGNDRDFYGDVTYKYK